jgi:hypothetical protein
MRPSPTSKMSRSTGSGAYFNTFERQISDRENALACSDTVLATVGAAARSCDS